MNNGELESLGQVLELFELRKVVVILMGIALLILFAKLTNNFSDRLIQKFPFYRLLIFQISTVLTFAVYIIGCVVLFYGALNPSKELLLAIGGSLAVAIGFSLKDLVSSFISGLILLFDRPFQVGDRVSFEGTYGEIRSIGLRAVRLVTLDDNLVTIPNAKLMTEVVSSGNAGALDMMVVMDFHIALDADLDHAKKVVFESVVTSRYAYLKKPVILVTNEVEVAGRLALQIKTKAYVLDVKYEKAFQTDVVSRVSTAFLQEGIRRPVLFEAAPRAE